MSQTHKEAGQTQIFSTVHACSFWNLDNSNPELGKVFIRWAPWPVETRKQTTFSPYRSRGRQRVSCGVWCERNSSCGDAALSLAHIHKQTQIYTRTHTHTQPCTHWHGIRSWTQILKYLKLTFIIWNIYINHSKPCIMNTHSFTLPVDLYHTASHTRLTFGYVLDVIITHSTASPRLLCGTAFCNYCQYSHSHHISHTQPATHDLSHILGHLHIRGK